MDIQRYVSPDLTHFVGRTRQSLEKQYQVLKKILRSGKLRASRPPGLSQSAQRAPYALLTYPSKRLSTNKAFRGTYVCFADIPVGDLGLHIEKYGRFGLAFTKNALTEKGAAPIMYVPEKARPAFQPMRNSSKRGYASEATAFDEFWRVYQGLAQQVQALRVGDRATGDLHKMADRIATLMNFLNVNILSHLKFFNHRLADWEKKNYYLEREWRINGDLNFELDDVRRVIIGTDFGEVFRSDFPDYTGEVLFID
jgi:hypothetical protein